MPAPRAPRVALATLACSLATLGLGCLGAPRVATIAPRDLEGPSASALREACTPSGIERCFDAVDDNCDGAIDEGCGLMTGLLQFVIAWPVASADVTVEACCDTAGCWYVADGTRFDCAEYDCFSAAEEVVSYCEDAYGGCSTSAERAGSGSAAFGLLGLLGLATTVRVGRWLRARKKKSN